MSSRILVTESEDLLSFDEALECEEDLRHEENSTKSLTSNDTPGESSKNISQNVSSNINTPNITQEIQSDIIGSTSANTENGKFELTAAQKARIERNRQKAKVIREGRLIPHPYAKPDISPEKITTKLPTTKLIDTGGGFLLEEKEVNEQQEKIVVTDLPGPILNPGQPTCIECQEQFPDSYLYRTFDHSVCDSCRDSEDKHSLITKTDIKNQYLLKDCDIEKRDPPLKFIVKKNPHNQRWGDMKLYLHLQVEKRALEVWGSEEALAKEHELREEKRCKTKLKKYNKQLKSLRMNVRSSLYDKTSHETHKHKFGPDSYNEDDDTYGHTCKECGYEETFEKM